MKDRVQRIMPPTARRALQWLHRNILRPKTLEDVFDYRPDDVVIVSYPKSGSTWLRFIMAHLINHMMPDGPKEVDFLRAQLIVPEISKEACRQGVDFEALPSPRIMRSHSLYNANFPKVIYLMRDGRDVLVSYYHHVKKFQGFQGTLYDFLYSDVRQVEWHEHVNSWIFQNPSLSNIYIVKYENMRHNPFQEVARLVAFIGLQRSDEQIREAIEGSDFHTMKQIEERKGLGYVDEGDKRTRFVRKGGIGEWKQAFGPREIAFAKEKYGATLIKAGYESSYQWQA